MSIVPQLPPSRQSAPAETLTGLNQGINLYTDPYQTNPKMWAAAFNVYSGMYGYLARARWANVVTASTTGYSGAGLPFTTLSYFAIPGLSDYVLGDNNGKLWSFDTSLSYKATQRLNPYIDPAGAGSSQLNGPWSRQSIQNISYEMNGQVKQSGRGANAAIIEGFGLDAPDSSPQVIIAAGTSATISSITRTNGTVSASLSGAITVPPAGLGGGLFNVAGVTDASFNGTFTLITGNGTSTIVWAQTGQNTSSSGGTLNTNILKSVGRSYAWAWENVNKVHVSAPSPSTQFIDYNNQNGEIVLQEPGTVSISSTSPVVTGTGTFFTSAWVGRSLFVGNSVPTVIGPGDQGRILSVQSSTQLTLAANATTTFVGGLFQVFDPQATHLRLYATSDGGASYFRVQRNAFIPTGTQSFSTAGLVFYDNANAEPPAFPYTTELSQLYNLPPPIGTFMTMFQGVNCVYGVPGALQTFFYSNSTLTTIGQLQESYAPLNQVTLPIANASINGMVPLPGALIIWSDKQDMFKLTGQLTDNTSATAASQGSSIVALPYNLGCASPYAAVLTPLGALWLTSNAEVWLFTDSYAPKNIGHPIQPILKSINPEFLSLARAAYYQTFNRNWMILAIPANGASENNTLLILDLDLLASNGSPSFFVFDMATNSPVWYPYNISCPSLLQSYEFNGQVRLFAGGADLITDVDFQQGFGTEISVPGSVTLHPWGNDHPTFISRPSFARFVTNQDTSQLALQGWSFTALGIDNDVYTFEDPLVLNLTPGVNDTATLSGNPLLVQFGESFRFSQSLFRFGGVNFMAGRRIQFTINFPSAPGADYRLREIQLGFGPEAPS